MTSVHNQTYPPNDVVVVIDHNLDLYNRALESLPGTRVIENSETRGLSGARNTGINSVSGEIVAFLDDDAVATTHWLENLVAVYTNPSVIGVGGAIEPMWQTRRPRWFPLEFDWVVGCTYTGMPRERASVRNLIGANMSFRRDVFIKYGGFRNNMGRVMSVPTGCEETELCIRICQYGSERQLLYEPKARILHRVPASRARWSYFQSRCYFEGLSKAQVSRLVGKRDGLASERAYTLHTLPSGFLRGMCDFVLHADISGVTRAGAIMAGLILTTVGYLKGSLFG